MSGRTDDDRKSSMPPGRRSDLRELEPVRSERRPVVVADPADRWLDDVIDLSLRLRVDDPPAALAHACVDEGTRLLPACAVGACVVDPASGEQLVARRLPADLEAAHGSDPTRLFPELPHELVLPLAHDHGSSTFHVASNDPDMLASTAAPASVARRIADVLDAALVRSQEHQSSRESSEELRRLQAQVIQAEKLASLGQIVAGVVHELNNPLTSIVAYSDYLRKRATARNAEDDVERLRRIGEAAERILKFSRDLVAYARPSVEVPGPVTLHEVIDKALVFCEHEFAESNVIVRRDLARTLPSVRGVAGQLTQVFVNLFTNAAHAMLAAGGDLTVRTRLLPDRETVLINIEDQGIGMPHDVLEQIFEPFFTTKTDGRGTGLGLSIVRDIVVSHGGTLDATSVPGRGTVFNMTLQVQPDGSEDSSTND